MTMDVDFMLCSDLRKNFASLPDHLKELAYNGSAVFVVPAFEFAKTAAEIEWEAYPSDKPGLMKYVKSNDIGMFHGRWKRGHGPTDYDQWYKTMDAYPVSEFNYNYEPYVLMKRDGLPW